MFLVSGPDLVVETCRSGIMGTFPALNQRTSEGYVAWLDEIQERLDRIQAETGAPPSPFAVNLIVHKTNARLTRDLEITVQHRVPIGSPRHSARCVMLSTPSIPMAAWCSISINLHHSNKASEAGVDGLIAVCAGAGGHAGLLNPFAFVAEIRQILKPDLDSFRRDHAWPSNRRSSVAGRRPGLSWHPLYQYARSPCTPRPQRDDPGVHRERHCVHFRHQRRSCNFLRATSSLLEQIRTIAIIRQAYRFLGRRGESLERCVVGRARSRRYSRYSFGGRALPALGGGISRGDSGAYLGPAGATPIA